MRRRAGDRRRRRDETARASALERLRREYPAVGPRSTLAVVLPTFEEARSIRAVLDEIPAELEGLEVEPIVVVDGGGDESESIAREAGAVVAVHPTNVGQGGALRTGFAAAIERKASIVVTMDADGQHRPDEVHRLVKPIVAGDADYVQGSRFLGEYDDAGGVRGIGIGLFTRLVNVAAGTSITDCTNGFRAIRADGLRRLELAEDRFSAAEIIIQSARNGLRILEVPVHIRRRRAGQSKKPKGLGYPSGFLGVIVRSWWRARVTPGLKGGRPPVTSGPR